MFDHDDDDVTDAMDEAFRQGPPEDRDAVADGKYQVEVAQVELAHARISSKWMLKWQLRILGPTSAGRMLFKNSMLVTPENARWLAADLKTCGVHLVSLRELRGRLGDLLGIRLEVTKKTKGAFENVHFNKKLAVDAGTAGGRGVDASGGEIPF